MPTGGRLDSRFRSPACLFPLFGAPVWIRKVVTTLVVLGLPIALVFAWAFELTPEGLKRTEDGRPKRRCRDAADSSWIS